MIRGKYTIVFPWFAGVNVEPLQTFKVPKAMVVS
jgi:hypothetical protein